MTKDSWEGEAVRIGKVHLLKNYNSGEDEMGCGYTYCGISVGCAILVEPSAPNCKSCVKAHAKKSQDEGSAK